MENKIYVSPVLEVETFEAEDVLAGSGFESVNNVFENQTWSD